MDSDVLKQQEIIKPRELKREVEEETKDKDLEYIRKAKEEIGRELKDLTHYRDKIKEEYQNEISKHSKLNKKIELFQSNLQELESQKGILLKQLDEKLLEKTKELNSFKESKKDFVNKLKNREKELQEQGKELTQQFDILSTQKQEASRKEKLLENGLQAVQKREAGVNALQAQLRLTRANIQRDLGVVEANLRRTTEIKQGQKQELLKQQNISKSFEGLRLRLKQKIEAQDKREAPVKRWEKELAQREIKLLDDRQALQRASKEIMEKYGRRKKR